MSGREAWNKGIVKTEEQKLEQRRKCTTSKKVVALNKETGEVVKVYDSLGDISREFGFSRGVISYSCSKLGSPDFDINRKYQMPFHFIFEKDFVKTN